MDDILVDVALSIRAAQSEGTTEPAVLRPVPHLGDQATRPAAAVPRAVPA